MAGLFEPNGVYTFETLAPAILGTKIERATCEGGMNYDLAMASGYDNVGEKYRQIYPMLPAGTPDIPKALTYYSFLTNAGGRVLICEQWVSKDTIELISFLNIQIELKRKTPAELTRLQQVIRGAGFPDAVFTVNKV